MREMGSGDGTEAVLKHRRRHEHTPCARESDLGGVIGLGLGLGSASAPAWADVKEHVGEAVEHTAAAVKEGTWVVPRC